jgi:hypothetical protein
VLDHGLEQVDGAVDVDHVVVQGLLARLADGLEGVIVVSFGCFLVNWQCRIGSSNSVRGQ